MNISNKGTAIDIDKTYLQHRDKALSEIVNLQKERPYIHCFIAVDPKTDKVVNFTAHVLEYDFDSLPGNTDYEKTTNFISLFYTGEYDKKQIPNSRWDGTEIYLNSSHWNAAISTSASLSSNNTDGNYLKNGDLLFRMIPDERIYTNYELYTITIDR